MPSFKLLRLFSLMLLMLSIALAQDSKKIEVENGKTIILSTTLENPKPIVINKKSYPFVAHPSKKDEKIAILSMSYYAKPQNITLENGIEVLIKNGAYKKEQIQVQQSKIKPNPKNTERIKQEAAEAKAIYANHSQTRLWDSPFIHPMQSAITSPYGTARVFNGELRSYHGGTDFRAAVGKEIKATNKGKVVIAKHRFLAGGSVVLDHGEGIFSMYYHCSEILVKVGDIVEKGDIVALSGASGRVSGPHLHFGILVRGAQVDPLDFIAQVNALF